MTAKCPHCGERHVIDRSEQAELQEYGKVVIDCSACDRLYTLRDDGDGVFVSTPPL